MKSKHCHELISLPKQYFDDQSDTTDDFPLTVIIFRKITLWTSHSTSLQKKKLVNSVVSRETLRGFCYVGRWWCCFCWCFISLDIIHFMLFDIISHSSLIHHHQVYLYEYWPILYFQAYSSQSDLWYFHLTFLTFHCFAWSFCCNYGHVLLLLAPWVLRIRESVFYPLLVAIVGLLLMLLLFLRCFSCNGSAMDFVVFSTLGVFYLTLLSDGWLNLHLSRLP